MPKYYIGVDAGGTGCRARVTDADERPLGSAIGGPANTRIGMEALYRRLNDLVRDALRAAQVPQRDWHEVAVGMGIAGIRRPGVVEALAAFEFPFLRVNYESDAVIALLGAHGGGDGAILSLGTGSVGCGRIDGRWFTVGGYGLLNSDEGSGGAIGVSAIRHSLRVLDGRVPGSKLAREISARFDDDILKVIAWIDAAAPCDYAALAPLVLQLADDGDNEAVKIAQSAATDAQHFLDSLLARGAPRLSLVGGLAASIAPWLPAETMSRLSEPLGDAVAGALLLARAE